MIEYADPRKIPLPHAKPISLLAQGSSMLAWSVVAVGLLGGVGAAIGLALTPLLGVMAGIGLGVMLIIAAQCLRSARRRRAALLLSYVEQAVRLNLPLSRMLESAARGESTKVAKRLMLLRAAIEDGSPIGDALALAAPETPRRVIEMTNAAERNGRLDDTLARLLRDERKLGRRDPAGAAFGRAYAAVLVCTIAAVIVTLAIFVMPKLAQIMKDFGRPMPPITRAVAGASSVLAPAFGAAALLILLWMFGRSLRDALVARPMTDALKGLIDRILWYTPFAGAIERDRGLADACSVVADGLDAGRPLDRALVEADRSHLNAVLRERLRSWTDALAAGAQPDAAARAASMPQLVCGMLATAQKSGNAADVFRFLARHYDARFSRAGLLIQSAIMPAMAIVAGAVVCATVLGIFIPMISLIDEVSVMPGAR